jgi:hypothetical protein
VCVTICIFNVLTHVFRDSLRQRLESKPRFNKVSVAILPNCIAYLVTMSGLYFLVSLKVVSFLHSLRDGAEEAQGEGKGEGETYSATAFDRSACR